jgi:hypothetical protein
MTTPSDGGNRWATALAAATGAPTVSGSDGGITGPAFFDHVRRLRRPVVNCPKGQTTPVPPDLMACPIERPAPYWTWSLVSRRHERRPVVRAVVDAFTRAVDGCGLDSPDAWLPPDDPHRAAAPAG